MSEVIPEIIFRRSNRLLLRPVLESDVVLRVKWLNDPETSRYISVYTPITVQEQRERLEKEKNEKPENIIVMIVVEGKPIGTMGIHSIDHRHGTAETGALIGEKDYLGKGYGTEAKMLILEYAFNTLNLRKVYSEVLSFNKRSLRYGAKCGYREEARLKDDYYAFGKYWDRIITSVFKEDWQPLWNDFAQKNKKSLLI